MINSDLQVLRKMLFLDVAEAASAIGDVTVRTWQRWEDGTRKVPADVINDVNDFIAIMHNKLAEHIEGQTSPHYYANILEWELATGKSSRQAVVFWRMSQAIYAQALAMKMANEYS